MAWRGVAWRGGVRRGMVRYGRVWCGAAWFGAVCFWTFRELFLDICSSFRIFVAKVSGVSHIVNPKQIMPAILKTVLPGGFWTGADGSGHSWTFLRQQQPLTTVSCSFGNHNFDNLRTTSNVSLHLLSGSWLSQVSSDSPLGPTLYMYMYMYMYMYVYVYVYVYVYMYM